MSNIQRVDLKMPKSMVREIEEALEEGIPYSNRTDLVKGAVRNELDAWRKRKHGTSISLPLDAPEPR
jgi:Arc/MetJ-type ribon-helix-helix transcriptional regulator